MKRSALIFLSLIVSLTSSATELFAQSGDELLMRIDKKMMPESYEAYRRIIDEYPDGKKKEFSVYTVKKDRDKVAMLFLAPASEKGRTTLRLGDNMWLYIPSVGKPIRITSLQSVTGGVFNNSDILQIDYSAEYDVVKVESSESGHVLDLKAKNRTVAYDKLKMWATRGEIITKIECFAESGMLIKTLEFKDIKNFGNGLQRPAIIETYSPLYKGYRSMIVFSQVKARTLNDEVFSINYMSKLEALRK